MPAASTRNSRAPNSNASTSPNFVRNIVSSREERGENEWPRSGPFPETIGGAHSSFRVYGMRLERVIENLLDNAVSFSPEGSTIEVIMRCREGRIIMTVCDEGPGIPAEKREKVFHRFHSDRPEEEDFGNHSGLGLAIGRTIAEAHDGTLHADERADGKKGACLVLDLPAAK